MTGLTGYLKERGLKRAYFVGLATDFCVAWSALDARKAGFEAIVIEDATRGIDAGGSMGKRVGRHVERRGEADPVGPDRALRSRRAPADALSASWRRQSPGR